MKLTNKMIIKDKQLGLKYLVVKTTKTHYIAKPENCCSLILIHKSQAYRVKDALK